MHSLPERTCCGGSTANLCRSRALRGGGLATIAFLDRLPSLWEWPADTKEGGLRAANCAAAAPKNNKRKALAGPSNLPQDPSNGKNINLDEDDEDETHISKEDLKSALDDLDGHENDDGKGTNVPKWQTMNAEEWGVHSTNMMKRLKRIDGQMDKLKSKPDGGLRKSNQ